MSHGSLQWTRLAGSPEWNRAESLYASPDGRFYHGFHHVLRLYEVAAETGVPYDADLDYGILYHDAIYEGDEDDVRRSAEALLSVRPGAAGAVSLIMTTETHAPTSDNRLVLLDLHDLTIPDLAAKNRELLAAECLALKGVGRDEFDRGSRAFLCGLRRRISAGIGVANQSDADAFRRIILSLPAGSE